MFRVYLSRSGHGSTNLLVYVGTIATYLRDDNGTNTLSGSSIHCCGIHRGRTYKESGMNPLGSRRRLPGDTGRGQCGHHIASGRRSSSRGDERRGATQSSPLRLGSSLCMLESLSGLLYVRCDGDAPRLVASSNSCVSTCSAGSWTYRTTDPRMKQFFTAICMALHQRYVRDAKA